MQIQCSERSDAADARYQCSNQIVAALDRACADCGGMFCPMRLFIYVPHNAAKNVYETDGKKRRDKCHKIINKTP